jgi:hypothetical protein
MGHGYEGITIALVMLGFAWAVVAVIKLAF